MRFGARLSPKQADIFDVIERQSGRSPRHKRSGNGGIRSDVLASMFGGSNVVKVHISAINKLLMPQGWRIVCVSEGSAKGFYFVRRSKLVDRGTGRGIKSPLGSA